MTIPHLQLLREGADEMRYLRAKYQTRPISTQPLACFSFNSFIPCKLKSKEDARMCSSHAKTKSLGSLSCVLRNPKLSFQCHTLPIITDTQGQARSLESHGARFPVPP
ncbi:homeobox protein unc-4-like protein [Platysternon megacephalum]|uniref:Homeobox protein unc-4-like protein n=1 Tax=Platysternon megacephalum TaxID=55544 RepID=A0A4D9DUH4_9SAUR|nr:homeobox protein unc-4-like protein [Platysternon megacephalum]